MTDNTMSDNEKIVRESIIHGKAWCIETEAAFDRLMAIAPHGEMKSAEEWADMLAMKGLERNDMRNVVISIQQDAIASRTATGDGALREALAFYADEKNYKTGIITGSFDPKKPPRDSYFHSEYVLLDKGKKAREALSAAPTHDAVRDAALEEAALAVDQCHAEDEIGMFAVYANRIRSLKSPTVEKKA